MPDVSGLEIAPPTNDLRKVVRDSWEAGKSINLRNAGAVYGPAHWAHGKQFWDEPLPYYHFLAGLARSQGCRRVLEIGTHFGGSAVAMAMGVSAGELVTIDITDKSEAIRGVPGVRKLVGDANSESIIRDVIMHFGGKPIDLLYIDAAHTCHPTLLNFGIYTALLNPRYVVIDDVSLSPDMADMWRIIASGYPGRAVNAALVVPEIRPEGAGFGLIAHRSASA